MKVEILGTSFTLESDESPEYLEQVVDLFSTKVQELAGSVDTTDPLKLAILAGILAIDEHLKSDGPKVSDTMRVSTEELDEAERITLELIEQIDSTLEEAGRKPDESENTSGNS